MIIDWKTNSLQYERKTRYKRYQYVFSCPTCKRKKSLRRHGYYKRYLIQWNGCIKEEQIRILRMRCRFCRHTHAVLPRDVIPHKVYGWTYYWTVLRLLSAKEVKVSQCVAVLGAYDKLIYTFLRACKYFFKQEDNGYKEFWNCFAQYEGVRKIKQLRYYTTCIVNRINV